ncbi:thioesterase II family protein [Stackebrandtia nassauensis]|uniref:Thioesterase n=1 Tax=Stackebrandtia nassauensis (strain DSM 44728 / CIP 108903 / NRRL B-16338 / NBRC 102104 / LLR-40K-21) TaxID=446470 RepID=D3Q1R1_STANL|nr:alpha/beta fold hydrolase [Stackebrandtia nassauensis]ADD39909.1 Thioesterase [Stackebrandtia nassauensis DSM 44728]
MHIRTVTPKPAARVHLIGFPGAGGSQTHFRRWDSALGPWIRLSVVDPWSLYFAAQAAEVDSLPDLASLLLPELAVSDSRFVLAGHSFGALLAYETARQLDEGRHGDRLAGLVAMAQRAPTTPAPERISHLGDDRLLRFLRDMGGTPEEVFAEPELLDLLLGRLRDEIRLSERYRDTRAEPLDRPLRVYFGDQDSGIAPIEARKWTKSVTGDHVLRTFPGGHFFPFDDFQVVSALLEDTLTKEPLHDIQN